MFKLLTLSLLALTLSATPFFPDFTNDGRSIQGSPLIGQSITGAGRYLFALDDQRHPASDFDYNDLYGELTYFGPTVGAYSFTIQGGLGAYFNQGTVSFAGARLVNDVFTLVFNTPTGEMYSGTPQVLIYQLESFSDNVPEPTTAALAGASLLTLAALAKRKGSR